MTKRILGIFAHPDDEGFGLGGTLAYYARRGAEVGLVCATLGEAGQVLNPEASLKEGQTLAEVRKEEMQCAARTLGVSDLTFLGYRDSGMPGDPENEHPRAFAQASAMEVVPQLVKIIRRFQPHIVLTFEPFGGYGHPDHIAIHRHTVAAFDAAADESQFQDAGGAWEPQRLFYPILPNSFFMKIRDRLADKGEDTSDIDEILNEHHRWPEDQIHLIMDVSEALETKWAALECHHTQFGPNTRFRRLPEETMRAMMSREYFALARPAPKAGLRLQGFFDGIEAPVEDGH